MHACVLLQTNGTNSTIAETAAHSDYSEGPLAATVAPLTRPNAYETVSSTDKINSYTRVTIAALLAIKVSES